ncbi:hypothetical protein BpOF4_20309 (plasmid) [Alkalihalophilus pseudofirmus OF4]|uniref:DUF3951 domain-containing protein n=1 Tax=Alkalihalophilus pseudofirmus (strain ATCC BAA-2126 / JCM 17055 / OF4) TaxID=398511 RepID=D3G133_ALKPO|nr:hypothetical protein BpOF4_20309 [Alkalihalophilus pseudofirmus OF4]
MEELSIFIPIILLFLLIIAMMIHSYATIKRKPEGYEFSFNKQNDPFDKREKSN